MRVESGYSQSCGGEDGVVGVKPPEHTVGTSGPIEGHAEATVLAERWVRYCQLGPNKGCNEEYPAFLPLTQSPPAAVFAKFHCQAVGKASW